jgi:hypothetical protein
MGMQRDVMWQHLQGLGLEHLHLTSNAEGYLADGMLLAIDDAQPYRASYTIWCDTSWRVQQGIVTVWENPKRSVFLQAGPEGHLIVKTDAQAKTQARLSYGPALSLDACIDIDIYPSPFTNTLPIRRLQLASGESAEITVAFIKLPQLTIRPVKQRYTCLESSTDGGRYRYEDLDTGFQAELPVNADGLVLDYPLWFRRVWP